METPDSFFKELYKNFNDRNIDMVIKEMDENVKWANGMDGGYVYGHDGVREYWTRQFTLVSSNVTPLEVEKENDVVKVKVYQVVHDVNKQLLADEIVYHLFRFKENKIVEFDIA